MRIAPAFFLLLSACAGDGISWGPVTYGEVPSEPRAESATLPARGGAGCADVVVVARGEARYAAWWEARADGSSALMLARSPDGGVNWETPIVADGRDRGGLRCSRPPPSLFADGTSEYLHLTYHISPRGSPGVYFTHSMKASALGTTGEGVLHMPVAVTHGDRPVLSSVSGRGDTIVVAFEDPNSVRPRVLLAYSTGAGHVFSTHGVVSPAGPAASSPRVSLAGDSVRVRWLEETSGGARRAATRSGKLP
ncbi:MAG: sialidase family protein [Gemmatimonadaceae bacterium]